MLLKNKLTTVALQAEFHVLEEKQNSSIALSERFVLFILTVLTGEEGFFGLSFQSNLVKKAKVCSYKYMLYTAIVKSVPRLRYVDNLPIRPHHLIQTNTHTSMYVLSVMFLYTVQLNGENALQVPTIASQNRLEITVHVLRPLTFYVLMMFR